MTGTPPARFRISEVSKTYGVTRPGAIKALQIDSLSVWGDETTAVLGYSGSGKSTLLHVLGLLDEPDPNGGDVWLRTKTGTVSYRQISAQHTPAEHLRRSCFGFVFQAAHLLGHFSAQDNIGLPLALKGVDLKSRRQRAQELLGQAHLSSRQHALPHQLAGGEAQRVAVLRAIAHDPEVILADEPTGNLDPSSGSRIMELLTGWRRSAPDRSLILVTHNFHQAFEFADRFVMLCNGRVIFRGRKESASGPAEEQERLVLSVAQLFDALDSGRERVA